MLTAVLKIIETLGEAVVVLGETVIVKLPTAIAEYG